MDKILDSLQIFFNLADSFIICNINIRKASSLLVSSIAQLKLKKSLNTETK